MDTRRQIYMGFKLKKLFVDNDDDVMQNVSEDEFYTISKDDAMKEAESLFPIISGL